MSILKPNEIKISNLYFKTFSEYENNIGLLKRHVLWLVLCATI